ncbi:MAG: hypothetical protein Q4C74_05520 [Rothia sp. (in: high G+C Gram-positive bacteria)]|nr:hypothetical protein [Rothia sp. (in: high G+C Gram-positive bacteria)]
MARVRLGPVKLICILAYLEVVMLLVLGFSLTVVALSQGHFSIFSSLMLGGFFLLLALLLTLGINLLSRGKPSGRSILLVWQLFAIMLGVHNALAGQLLVGILVAVIAAIILLLLFSSAVNRHLVG